MIWFLLLLFLSCAQREYTYKKFLMGGQCNIKFYCNKEKNAKSALEEIDEELVRLDSLLNYFSPKSLVSEINHQHRAKLDKDILYLFSLSDSISRLTNGLFDISVAPLLEIWGFYQGEPKIPSARDIERAKKLVNFRKIELKSDSIFIPEGMRIDLGGIAQGFAADIVGDILRKLSIKSAIINIAGEVLAIGRSPKNKPWRVGIKNPRGEGIIEIVELEDGALSTSGDYEKFFMINGKRYPHIINPKTGVPAQEFASVTIFEEETAFSDGMATAVAVMGAGNGLKFLDSLKIKGIIYHEKDGKLLKSETR